MPAYKHIINEPSIRPKLYFVKVDVQACFDTIEQSKLLQILRDVLSGVCHQASPGFGVFLIPLRIITSSRALVRSCKLPEGSSENLLWRHFLMVGCFDSNFAIPAPLISRCVTQTSTRISWDMQPIWRQRCDTPFLWTVSYTRFHQRQRSLSSSRSILRKTL